MSAAPSPEVPPIAWRQLAEGSSDGVVLVDASALVRWCNGSFARLLGYASREELLGRPFDDLLHPEDRPAGIDPLPDAAQRERGSGELSERRLLLRDGTTLAAVCTRVELELEGERRVGVVVRDVSHERRRRARFAQADRMSSLGALAGGVAHEINNPLTYVLLRLGAVGGAARKLRSALVELGDRLATELGEAKAEALLGASACGATIDEIGGHVETASEGAARVRKIVNDLRMFARSDDEAREPVDLERPLEIALGMATHELKHRATVVREYAPLPPALGSESRLAQVFLNLLLNAAQAIPEGQPMHHRVVLRTGVEGERVYASVSDTGRGIAPEHLSRIFEPFFASGEAPSGGLGLAICHGIVHSLGGSIRVSSRPGEGAVFTVLLPIAQGTAQASSSGSPRS